MTLPAIGDLNRRLTLKKQADMPAMGAGVSETFSTVSLCWAKIVPVGTAIFFGTKQVDEGVTHRIFVRRVPGVITELLIDANHVFDQTVNGENIRYRVRRASDLEDARDFLMIDVELLGNV